MAREIEHVDVGDAPELRRLAEEVQRSKQPRVLRRDGEALAIVLPVSAGIGVGGREHVIEAQIWADAGVFDPSGVWADYDPTELRAALRQAQGALAGVDRAELIKDIYEAREQDPSAGPT